MWQLRGMLTQHTCPLPRQRGSPSVPSHIRSAKKQPSQGCRRGEAADLVSVVIKTGEGESFARVQHPLKAFMPPGPAKAAITSGRRRNDGNVWNVSMETAHLSLVSNDVLRVKVELMWGPSAGCSRKLLQDTRPQALFHLLWPTHLPESHPRAHA